MTYGTGNTRRALLGSTAAGLSGAALAACGATGSGGDAKPTTRTTPVNISFLSWRPNAMDRFEAKWKEWGDKNKVTISIEKVAAAGDRNTMLTARLAADQAPDCTDSHSDADFARCEAGAFAVLDPLLSRDKLSQDKGYGLTYAEKWRGKTYQLSYWVEPFGIYYNKTMFQKKGIPDPWAKSSNPGTWTIEEMVDAARRATNPADNEWGFDWSTGYHELGPLIWTQGATHYNYDPFGWQLDNPATVQVFQWFTDWTARTKYNIAAPAIIHTERTKMMDPWGQRALDNNGMTPFANGKVAIHYRSVNDWSRMFPVVKDQFQWDIMPLPSIGGKPGASWTAGHPVNMWSKSKQPDAAWDFMKFLISDDFQKFMSEAQVLVPAKVEHQANFYRAPSVQPHQHAKVFADVFKKPHGIAWRNFKSAENGTVWNEYRDKIISGQLGLANGVKEATARLNQDNEWGGGANPFAGLKLPIVPK
jgi:multiple sugar transport system substrate-binding protein